VAAFRPADPAKEIPAVSLVDGDGAAAALADYRGRGLVVNFWATWCAPCVREMPALDRLASQLGGDGIAVLALSGDHGGANAVRSFYGANGIRNLPILLDAGLRGARALKIDGLPTTVLVDAGGREVGRLVGPADWDSAEALALVRDCLTEKGS